MKCDFRPFHREFGLYFFGNLPITDAAGGTIEVHTNLEHPPVLHR